MTVDDTEEGLVSGPRTSQASVGVTPKLSKVYFDEMVFYAPTKKDPREKMLLCKTIILIADTPICQRYRGPVI